MKLALRAGQRFRRDPLAFIREREEWADLIAFHAGFTKFTLVNHPEIVRRVLVSDNDSYGEGKWSLRGKHVLGDSVITREGAAHRERRSLIAPGFHRRRLEAYSPVLTTRTERFSNRWRDGERIDARKEMGQLAIAMTGEALFEADLEQEAAELDKALGVLLRSISLVPLPRPATRAARRYVASVAVRLKGGHIVPRLYESGLSEKQVVDEVISVLLAAVDTTPRALAFAWLMLAAHPEAESRLHDELSTILAGRSPVHQDLAKLAYLRAIIDETLRMYPPVHFIDRRPLKDVELAGSTVRAGSYMLLSPLITQRDPRFFDRPDSFDPDRWIDTNDGPPGSRLVFPFGAGAHGCLGEQLARLEMSITLATLAQHWRLRLGADSPGAWSPQTLCFPMTLERRR